MIVDLVNKIALHCSSLEYVKAVGLIGSRVSSHSKNAGDWDLYAFTNLTGNPDDESRRKLWSSRSSPVASESVMYGAFNDRFTGQEVNIGIDYFPLQQTEQQIEKVMVQGDIRPSSSLWFTLVECPEAICADITMCKSLWDPDGMIKRLQDSVAEYPVKFRLSILCHVLDVTRAKLQQMRRASELDDIALFHMTLSDVCFCLIRMLFALNKEYFRGPKWALQTISTFKLVPKNFCQRMESLLSTKLSSDRLHALMTDARTLVKEFAEFASQQGPEEKKAIGFGLGYWPDMEPLD